MQFNLKSFEICVASEPLLSKRLTRLTDEFGVVETAGRACWAGHARHIVATSVERLPDVTGSLNTIWLVVSTHHRDHHQM